MVGGGPSTDVVAVCRIVVPAGNVGVPALELTV
jgi:hypothetical protein